MKQSKKGVRKCKKSIETDSFLVMDFGCDNAHSKLKMGPSKIIRPCDRRFSTSESSVARVVMNCNDPNFLCSKQETRPGSLNLDEEN